MAWRQTLGGAALAGLALGAVDVALALGRHGARLPSLPARLRFALALAALVALGVVALAAVAGGAWRAARALPPRARGLAAVAGGALAGLAAGVAAFSGSGVRRSGLRGWLLGAAVAAGALGAALAWRRRAALRAALAAHPAAARAAAAAAAAGAYVVHATVLVRQYPEAHALAAGLCAAAAAACAAGLAGRRVARAAPALVAGVALAGAAAAVAVAGAHADRALARQGAPLGRYPVALVGRLTRDDAVAPRSHRDERIVRGPHLPLVGRDLVLVTIDALRADRLRACGGVGRMPVLDAMAARGVVFRRAYCTTPHTSYSVASLMTGKYLRSVLALPGPARRHETLAGMLGAAGYATAGFFPPAVFSVDGDRFADLRRRVFDFRDRREGYAAAPERVREVEAWLAGRAEGERVFVWVHFFEPHEPYEAHAAHPYGASAADRYDAEVSAADDALGALREAFARRGRRPAWVVTADHGEELGDHGGSFHGTSVYDEQVRVPLVVEVPGVAPRVVDAPASLVDVVPTVLAGVGIPRPPRLRGNDLGPLAFGAAPATRAYASTGSLRTVVEGSMKLVVDLADGTRELYDLARDPREAHNLADARRADAAALHGAIGAWEASHARYEAEGETRADALADVELPPALHRAIQGDASVAREVAGMLPAGGAPVRRRAARVLGDLGVRDAAVRDALARALHAPDAELAREAGLSLALLADPRGRGAARAAMRAPDVATARRAARGLARLGDHAAVPVLAAWVTDATAPDAARDEAVVALRALRDPRALGAWTALLGDNRLAPVAARALGELGDHRAVPALEAALAAQVYPLSIRAIAGALVSLNAGGVRARVAGALAGTDPLPDAFALLRRVGEPGGEVAGLVTTRPLGPRAVVVRVAGGGRIAGRARVYLHVRADEATAVELVSHGAAVAVPAGEHEVAVDVARGEARALRVRAAGPATLLGVVIAPLPRERPDGGR